MLAPRVAQRGRQTLWRKQGRSGQAGAGEAAERARVLGAAVPGPGLLQVQRAAEGRPRRGAVRGLESP